MSGSTVNSSVLTSVTLNSSSYPNPLTITGTGRISPSYDGTAGSSAIVIPGDLIGSIENDGVIIGGGAPFGIDLGVGITLGASSTLSLTGSGSVSGASGQGGSAQGAAGASGASLTSHSSLYNGSDLPGNLIKGGTGGSQTGNHVTGNGAGDGGAGIYVSGIYSTVGNAGALQGGTGGYGFDMAGTGGYGARVYGGYDMLRNSGRLNGGTGGNANYNAGIGGAGLYISNYGTAINIGTIGGGQGGNSNQSGTDFTGGTGGAGVYIARGGDVTNATTGLVLGGRGGADGTGGNGVSIIENGYLTNHGTLVGGLGGGAGVFNAMGANGGVGLYLNTSRTTENDGTIIGGTGGYAYSVGGNGGEGVELQTGTLTNAGIILGGGGGANYAPIGGIAQYGSGGRGVVVNGGELVNTGTIIGDGGVYLDGGTFINAGTVAGTSADYIVAVQIGASASEVVVDPGAVFEGQVSGLQGQGNILALGGTSLGTIGIIGDDVSGFDTLSFLSGAHWVAQGYVEAFSTEKIDGFNSNDTLDLTDFVVTSLTSSPGGEITISNGTKTYELDIAGVPPSDLTFKSNVDGGTLIEDVTCFLRGTRLMTPRGERPVELLQTGDLVTTHDGRSVAVVWSGSWSFNLDTVQKQKNLRPIRISAGALAPSVPCRDLYVSPDHGIFLQNVLVPARLLLNDITITQPNRHGIVEYFHIQVEPHDLLLAERAAAESFLDLGNTRFSRSDEDPRNWEDACAPLVLAGPVVGRITKSLLERSAILLTA